MSTEIEQYFLNTKPVRALVVINNPVTESYASQVSSKIDSTYAHTVKILKKLDQQGLINKSEKDGRKVIAETTEKGQRVARRAQQLRAEIKEQPIQAETPETVFQGSEWNILKTDGDLLIECLSGQQASVDVDELEKAVQRLTKPEIR